MGGGCYASKAPDNECGQLQCIGEKRTRLNSQVVGSQSGDVHRANGATNNIDTHAKKPKCMNCCGMCQRGIPLGWGVDAVGEVKDLHCATPLFYCTVLTKPHMGVVVMVGTPCGVWAMGAMWMTQIMLVVDDPNNACKWQ